MVKRILFGALLTLNMYACSMHLLSKETMNDAFVGVLAYMHWQHNMKMAEKIAGPNRWNYNTPACRIYLRRAGVMGIFVIGGFTCAINDVYQNLNSCKKE